MSAADRQRWPAQPPQPGTARRRQHPTRGAAVPATRSPSASTCRCCAGMVVTIAPLLQEPLRTKHVHHPVPRGAARVQRAATAATTSSPRAPTARCAASPASSAPPPARPSASTSRPPSSPTSTSRSTRWSTRSTCCAASSAATASTPAPKRRSSCRTTTTWRTSRASSRSSARRDLMKPFTVDPERLGYRPYYPEEDAQARADARARPSTW